MVIEDSRPLVKSPSMPRVAKFELLQVEVMAELMTQSAEERAE